MAMAAVISHTSKALGGTIGLEALPLAVSSLPLRLRGKIQTKRSVFIFHLWPLTSPSGTPGFLA